MGGKTLPEPLALSPDDHHVLAQLRQGLHDEILGHYENYISRDRSVDATRWKLMRTEGNLHAFREREDAPEEDRESIGCQPQAWMAARSQFPCVLVVGSMAGSLDDAMYANAFHDTDSLRTNTLYKKTHDLECAVVSTLETASDDDPFRIACVNWSLCEYPIFRDRVVLTYTDVRFARLRNSDRVGMKLSHSIRHENFKMPTHSSRALRAECSMASVFRQIKCASGAKRVETFTVHFVDPKGLAQDSLLLAEMATTFMANTFVEQETTRSLLGMASLADTALNKKLNYRLRQRLRQRLPQRLLRKKSSSITIDTYSETPTQCEQCEKKLGGLFKSSGRTCQLCDKIVCGRCITKRELVVDATPVEKPFEFCEACITETRRMPASDVARAELLEREAKELELLRNRESKATTSSSTSGSPVSAHDRMEASPGSEMNK